MPPQELREKPESDIRGPKQNTCVGWLLTTKPLLLITPAETTKRKHRIRLHSGRTSLSVKGRHELLLRPLREQNGSLLNCGAS